jgi:polyhydroxyalkanoate synthesis regulator phasin
MATKKQETENSALGRLSKRGEDALTRLVDEVGKNERVSEAVGRALSAKGKLDGASRRALGQVGLAAADEVDELRKKVERLEKRLAKLEGGPGGRKTAASKKTTRTRTRKTTGKATEKAASPAAGRAVGGGTGRGSASGGTPPS